MEHYLCEAAITGDTDSLHNIIKNDPLILHKVVAGCFSGISPLHVATSNKQTHFVEELLSLQPELAEVLDLQQRSALHLASAQGHDEIVKLLLSKVGLEICLVRDRDGRNPLHIAAVKGKISALEELVRSCPEAARVRVDRNDTILHLCVKHNQLESLEKLLDIVQGHDFVNAKDNDGNTILHLAILYKRSMIACYVLEKLTIDVNATNASGHTAMDILFLGPDQKEVDHIEDLLRHAHAKQAKDLVGGDWLTNKRDSLMVVASLIATMAFQVGVNPPGGVLQKDFNERRAGEAVMAYKNQNSYPYFLGFNTIGFVASLSTILLLISGLKFKNKATMWVLIVTMWLAITSMAITYTFFNVVVTPRKDRRSLSYTVTIGVIVWSSMMALLLLKYTFDLVAIFAKEKRRRRNASNRIASNRIMKLELRAQSVDEGASYSSRLRRVLMKLEPFVQIGLPVLRKPRDGKDGGATPPPPLPLSTS